MTSEQELRVCAWGGNELHNLEWNIRDPYIKSSDGKK
jgi:hypothetical protein